MLQGFQKDISIYLTDIVTRQRIVETVFINDELEIDIISVFKAKEAGAKVLYH
jgi:sRNA-binding carbon storage regulator CsrA